jgi:putative ABC transport system ATP-binding protein
VTYGDVGDRFYLIREGVVSVKQPTHPGGSDFREVAELTEGAYFGETALLTGEPRNAHVDAKTETVTYSLDAPTFTDVMSQRKSIEEEVRSSLFAE